MLIADALRYNLSRDAAIVELESRRGHDELREWEVKEMRSSFRMLLPLLTVMTFVGLRAPLCMVAQTRQDVAPLKNWPAPLYWQPTAEE
jgi:hypothetical protein